MKLSKVLIVLGVVVVVAIGLYTVSSGASDEEYNAALLKERAEKDSFMKNSDESPFGDEKVSFKSLSYFDPNPHFKISAKLEQIQNKKVVVLPTSSGEESRYLEYARAKFKFDGVDNSLLLLEVMDMGPTRGTLFLAFADETSAKETYGAGRYIELKKTPGAGTMIIDFNKAYNPYCAYAEKYSCPFPPAENVLKIAVKAGEKNYH